MKTKTEVLLPAGKGAYNFAFAPTLLHTTARGTVYLIDDRWSGNGVEGECYRRYITGPLDAETVGRLRAARFELVDDVLMGRYAFRRVAHADAALRAIAKCADKNA